MFNNLIESSSHRGEFRRRGSFFLITTASYALLFVIAGVVSIYAYDARMEDQNLELATIMPLVDLPVPAPPKAVTPESPNPSRSAGNKQTVFERKEPIARLDQPSVAPDKISTTPNPGLPMPEHGTVVFNGRDSDPGQPEGSGSNTDNRNGANPNPVIVISEPPAPKPVPKPAVMTKGVITSEALLLPKPSYPEMAKQMRLQGKVTVQILIDETGKVVSARVLEGHPFFKQVSERAAYQARFSPTRLGDQPMKVSGVISYNFVLQ